MVFSTFAGTTKEQALATITAVVTVTTDPTNSEDARMTLSIVPWSSAASTLRLDMAGDPQAQLPVEVHIGDAHLQARPPQRIELIAFFIEASRLSKR